MPPADAAIHEFVGPVRRMVQAERAEIGFKAAIVRVARRCGLSERRVRAAEHGEVRAVLLLEMRLVQAAYDGWCRERSHRLSDELAAIEAEMKDAGL